METFLYAKLANLVSARINCIALQRHDAANKHADNIEYLCENCMPSGSGFDSGTKLDLDASSGDKLVFTTAFHHMTEHGVYDGWTEHRVYVTADLALGFQLRVTGKDRNGIKDYIGDTFHEALKRMVGV